MWADVSLTKVVQLFTIFPSFSLVNSFACLQHSCLRLLPREVKSSAFLGILSSSKTTTNDFFWFAFSCSLSSKIQISLEVDKKNAETRAFNDHTCHIQNKYFTQQGRKELPKDKKETKLSMSTTTMWENSELTDCISVAHSFSLFSERSQKANTLVLCVSHKDQKKSGILLIYAHKSSPNIGLAAWTRWVK